MRSWISSSERFRPICAHGIEKYPAIYMLAEASLTVAAGKGKTMDLKRISAK